MVPGGPVLMFTRLKCSFYPTRFELSFNSLVLSVVLVSLVFSVVFTFTFERSSGQFNVIEIKLPVEGQMPDIFDQMRRRFYSCFTRFECSFHLHSFRV